MTIRDSRDLFLVNQVSPDCWSHSPGPADGMGWGTLDYRVGAAGLEAIRASGMAHEILIPDLQAVIDAEAMRLSGGVAGRGWFEDYKTAEQVRAFLEQLAAARPEIARLETVGHSLENREIYALRLSGPLSPGVGLRPIVLINSVQHAREWITVMATSYLAEQLVTLYGTDARTTGILDRYEVVIIPVVNPDGYAFTWTTNRFWRKNRRPNAGGTFGVDNNRNWGFAWGLSNGSSGNGSSETYRGTAAFSEPENAAMRDWTLANPGVVMHLDVHSYGQYILYPWGYSALPTPGVGALQRLAVGMRDAILDSGGVPYLAGPCYQTLYPISGGSLDWYYGARSVLSWTPELRGPGFNPPPEAILPTAREWHEAVMWLAENFCAADVDRSGFLDTDDYDRFVTAFEEGDPAADYDRSGFVDTDDFDAFARAFMEGC
ncbi:MAG: hypothetical protein KF740_07125 [Ramlibacter sp.]|nr:hypothetical protein [Ramlibacter sp.]